MPELRYTTCPRDCPDACRIVATVENDRVIRLQGDKNHAVTRGFLCPRTSRFLARQYDPERLTAPLLRRNGELVPVDWKTALDVAAEAFMRVREESGPAAILHYRSGGSLGLLRELSDVFFAHFGPVTQKRGDICSGAGEEAQRLDFGGKGQNDLDDLANAKHIVLWGKNPATSSVHLLPRIAEARGRGATTWLIDPVHHRTAREVDHVIAPRPGSDLALAFAIARRCWERGGVHPDVETFCSGVDGFIALFATREVAEWARLADVEVEVVDALASAFIDGPLTVLLGWGLARRAFGGTTVRAIDALAALTGNVGVEGAGVSYITSRKSGVDKSVLEGPPPPRTLSEPLLGREILEARDPPIRAAFITCGNPVVMLPDSETVRRALSGLEFLVVVDTHLTDTARCADLVLPVATFLEDDDLVGSYGHAWLGVQERVAAPPEGVRTDLEILQGLAARTGLAHVLEGDADHWRARLLAPVSKGGASLEDLKRGPVRNPAEPAVMYAGRRFLTDDGRAHLLTTLPEGALDDVQRGLTLMSLSTPETQASQWSREPPPLLEARLHPHAAQGLADGAYARLVSPLGHLEVRLRHDPSLRTDVVVVPKGGHLARGQCVNTLIPAALTDLGEGAALYDVRVELEPMSGYSP